MCGPKISVVVPVYNSECFLRSTLDSLLAQTLCDIEIVCVNDGSRDSSLQILEEYSSKDSRVIAPFSKVFSIFSLGVFGFSFKKAKSKENM